MGDYRQVTFDSTAGTITSLAAMAQKLPTYGRSEFITMS